MRVHIVLCFVFVSVFAQAQDYFRLTGTITNPSQNYITFTLYQDWITEPKEYTLKLDNNNSFLVEFPLSEIAYCGLSFGENGLELLKIESNDKIHLEFDNDFFYESLKVSGQGSEKWQYQLLLKKKYEIEKDWDVELSNFKNLSKEQFFSKTHQLVQEQLSILPANAYSKDFYELQKADIIGKFKLKELGFLNSKKVSSDSLKLNWKQFPETTKAKSIYLGQLADAIIENTEDKSRHQNSKTLEYEFLKRYKTQFGQGLTEKILANKLLEYINTFGVSEEIKLLGEDYMFYSDNDSFKKVLATNFRKKEKLEEGKMAPNFIVRNSKGKLVELKDFRGRYIVLGFYDTECFFCIEDLEAMEYVEGFYNKRLKNELQFVFVNLSNKEDFKDFLKTKKPLGVHLNGYKDTFLLKNYNLTILPNYLIIDKSGKILSNTVDEPRLDDGRSLIQQLDRLIINK